MQTLFGFDGVDCKKHPTFYLDHELVTKANPENMRYVPRTLPIVLGVQNNGNIEVGHNTK
jgi:hypothetical protein